MSLCERLTSLRKIEKDSIYAFLSLVKFSTSDLGMKGDPLTLFAWPFRSNLRKVPGKWDGGHLSFI